MSPAIAEQAFAQFSVLQTAPSCLDFAVELCRKQCFSSDLDRLYGWITLH